ncbi:MAG TPA: c-type cytochrome [Longimicrobiaceae bacterium]
MRGPLFGPARRSALTVALLIAAGCEAEAPPAEQPAADAPAAAAESGFPLVPAEAGFDQVNALVKNPASDPLPDDSLLAAQIRRGFDIVEQTPQHAPDFVGNDLSCGNCHLNAGQRFRALPYTGIAATFPEPRRREGRLFSLEDRIRGCFMRSMNGTQPPYDSEELLAVSAYITWLSSGQPVGESPEWRGQNVIAPGNLLAVEQLDPARGRQLYLQQCTACHGVDGQGVDLQVVKPGPLWGPRSWNDGAGLARVYTLAGYIRYAMPLTQPGVLTDEEAQHVAAYINAQDRPVFAGKANDFPGGAPVDAVYYPRYPENPLRARLESAGEPAAP